MKKINLLALSIITLSSTFVSCTKNDKSTPPPTVVGAWKYKSIEGNVGTTTFPAGSPYNPVCTSAGQVSSLTLNSSATYSDVQYDAQNSCAVNTTTGPYTISSDNKNLVLDPGTQNQQDFGVTELSSTEMKLHESGQTQDSNGNTINFDLTITLNK